MILLKHIATKCARKDASKDPQMHHRTVKALKLITEKTKANVADIKLEP